MQLIRRGRFRSAIGDGMPTHPPMNFSPSSFMLAGALIVMAVLCSSPSPAQAATTSTPGPRPAQPVACRGVCWKPQLGDTFSWQLQGTINVSRNGAAVRDVDLFDTPTRVIRAIRARESPVCYITISPSLTERSTSRSSSHPTTTNRRHMTCSRSQASCSTPHASLTRTSRHASHGRIPAVGACAARLSSRWHQDIIGVRPTLYRPPQGVVSAVSSRGIVLLHDADWYGGSHHTRTRAAVERVVAPVHELGPRCTTLAAP